MGLALMAGGCGLRTPPQPLSRLIPPPQELRAWNRDGEVIVSWKTISVQLENRWKGVEAYRLSLARLPLGCADCRPLEIRELALPPDSRDLIRDRDETIYRFTPPGPPATWRVRLKVEFGRSTSPEAGPAFVDTVASIPSHVLQWERVGPETLGAGGQPAIRLYWSARRERIVYVVTPAGGQLERSLLYRVNLYRRVPPEPWPDLPLNKDPLTGVFWIGPEPHFLNDPAAKSVEFRIRLVDQLGNEGPASDPVSIPLAKGPGT